MMCLRFASTTRCEGTDYETDVVISGEMMVGCIHRVVSQTELYRLDGPRRAALSVRSAYACFKEGERSAGSKVQVTMELAGSPQAKGVVAPK